MPMAPVFLLFFRREWGLRIVWRSALFLSLGISSGNAQEVLTSYLNYTLSHDDNLLRLHDEAAALARTGSTQMSDNAHLVSGGLRFDKTVSQQRLTADLALSRVDYDHFSALDHTDKNVLGNWNWHLGNHLEGNAGSSYSETLAPIEDFRTPESNLRTQRRQYVDAAWLFHPSWRARAGYSHYDLRYSLAAQQANERTQNATELGLDYLARRKSTIGLRLNQIRSHAVHDEQASALTFQSYDQNEFKGLVDWWLTEPTQLQFLGGWVRRTYDNHGERDFSGFNARLTGRWQATSKLGLTVATWRELGSSDDLAASYALNHGLKLAVRWDLAFKLRLDSAVTTERRNYNGVTLLANNAAPDVNRSDRFTKYMLGVTWATTEKLQLTSSVFREQLNSNLANVSYRDNGVQLSARYQF